MPSAVVIHLKAARDAVIEGFTGAAIHGAWFRRWKAVDEALGTSVADRLHGAEGGERREFTLSPLMGLPRGPKQQLQVTAGGELWFRVTALSERLEQELEQAWLRDLIGQRLEVSSQNLFEVTGIARTAQEHSWAGQQTYAELAETHLYNLHPALRWRLEFATPTTFKNENLYFPFPLPNSLVSSWLERWQAFAPLALESGLAQTVRKTVGVAGYNLRTVEVREEERRYPGCTGSLRLEAHNLPPAERAALDLLAAYAFYCGSGHKTTQGQGLTRAL